MAILYRVLGGKNPLVLLGSIHIGFEEMYPFGEKLQAFLQNSDVFVFECDTDDYLSFAILQNESRYQAGDALRCHVSEETLDLLEEVCHRNGLRMGQLETYKPWAIVNALTPFAVKRLVPNMDVGELTALGVEKAVKKYGKGKSFAYLETVQEQLDALSCMSDVLQKELLRDTCLTILGKKSQEGMNADLVKWGKWWQEGNADAFASSYRTDETAETSPEYRRIMMTERNDRMAERIVLCLESETNHSYCVTVGLMHLVLAEDSILSKLEEAGYTIEQIR